MKVALIAPPLLGYKGDPFGNIPSLPTGVPYLAAYLRKYGQDVSIVDCFGESPHQVRPFKEFYEARGLSPAEVIARLPADIGLAGIGVHSGAAHGLAIELIQAIKNWNPDVPVVMGGAQATILYQVFLDAGADYVVLSEGEQSLLELAEALEGKGTIEAIDGLAWRGGVNPRTRFIEDLDSVPFPAIDLLPMQNYWDLKYAHGPVNGPYTFMLTSRGCPYGCEFCATPRVWQRRWRARSAKNVVDEMEHYVRDYDIRDYHIQDDNFTVRRDRVWEICQEIIGRQLDVTWCLPSAVKAEPIDPETLHIMREAGCRYIAFSPESGSERVLKLMNKPVDLEHMKIMVEAAHKEGMKTQACFVLGFPGETDEDLELTRCYANDLTRRGVDEISFFIMSPVPGAAAFDKYKWDFDDYEGLCWSPRWREDYDALKRARVKLYANFFWTRFWSHPLDLLGHVPHILTGRHETKAEMAVSRWLRILMGR